MVFLSLVCEDATSLHINPRLIQLSRFKLRHRETEAAAAEIVEHTGKHQHHLTVWGISRKAILGHREILPM
jgi:hypothetical protein